MLIFANGAANRLRFTAFLLESASFVAPPACLASLAVLGLVWRSSVLKDLLVHIKAKASELQERGEEIERTPGLPQDIIEWLYGLKLFKLMVPTEFGGRPIALPKLLGVLEELSAADGSVGWNVDTGTGAGFFVPSFSQEVAREMFSPREAVFTGTGFPAGRARRVASGYIVNGRWLYASGCQYASMFSANAVVEEDGEESVRAFAFYPDEVQVVHDWGAFGLKGTASHSWQVDDVFVPEERSFIVGDKQWSVPNPVYGLSFRLMASVTGVPVRLGIARRFFELAETLIRPQCEAEAQRLTYEAAQNRELFYALVDRWWPRLVAGEKLSESEEAAIIRTNKRLINDTIRAAQRMFPYLRMRALWESESVNRVYRDLLTSGHAIDLVG